MVDDDSQRLQQSLEEVRKTFTALSQVSDISDVAQEVWDEVGESANEFFRQTSHYVIPGHEEVTREDLQRHILEVEQVLISAANALESVSASEENRDVEEKFLITRSIKRRMDYMYAVVVRAVEPAEEFDSRENDDIDVVRREFNAPLETLNGMGWTYFVNEIDVAAELVYGASIAFRAGVQQSDLFPDVVERSLGIVENALINEKDNERQQALLQIKQGIEKMYDVAIGRGSVPEREVDAVTEVERSSTSVTASVMAMISNIQQEVESLEPGGLEGDFLHQVATVEQAFVVAVRRVAQNREVEESRQMALDRLADMDRIIDDADGPRGRYAEFVRFHMSEMLMVVDDSQGLLPSRESRIENVEAAGGRVKEMLTSQEASTINASLHQRIRRDANAAYQRIGRYLGKDEEDVLFEEVSFDMSPGMAIAKYVGGVNGIIDDATGSMSDDQTKELLLEIKAGVQLMFEAALGRRYVVEDLDPELRPNMQLMDIIQQKTIGIIAASDRQYKEELAVMFNNFSGTVFRFATGVDPENRELDEGLAKEEIRKIREMTTAIERNFDALAGENKEADLLLMQNVERAMCHMLRVAQGQSVEYKSNFDPDFQDERSERIIASFQKLINSWAELDDGVHHSDKHWHRRGLDITSDFVGEALLYVGGLPSQRSRHKAHMDDRMYDLHEDILEAIEMKQDDVEYNLKTLRVGLKLIEKITVDHRIELG